MDNTIIYTILLTISASFAIAAVIVYVRDFDIHHDIYWAGRSDGFNAWFKTSIELREGRIRSGLKLCRVIRFGRNKNLKRWEPVE